MVGSGVSWVTSLALFALAVALYGRGLGVGFVGDDYTLLDAARRLSLGEFLTGRHGIIGYYRPISRELYFWWWGKVLGFGPLGFHLVNTVTFAVTGLLFHTMLRRWQGARVATIATLAFVLFPAVGALLSWISCAQDLIVLFWGVFAMLLYRERRYSLAGIAGFLAALSKETGLIVPFALAALEICAGEPGRARRLPSRIAPAFIGLAAAIVVGVGVRLAWPAGTAVAVWSPSQALGAWRIPMDFLTTFVPPDTIPGIVEAAKRAPILLGCAAALALLAAPGSGSSAFGARASNPARGAALFGLLLILLGLLPVSVIVERWRAYFFGFAALGTSVLIGVTLASVPPWIVRALAVLAAVVSFGSNTVYHPVAASWGPARHPYANYAFFRDNAEFTQRLVRSLEPLCAPLRSVSHVFTIGVPEGFAFENLLGPARRVACRDTSNHLRSFAEFTPADAAAPFALLRFDEATAAFAFERADRGTQVRMAESFLMALRFDVAAACYRAAASEPKADATIGYLAVATLGAAGDTAAARAFANQLTREGRAMSPERLVSWTLRDASTPPDEGLRNRIARRAVWVLRDPLNGDEHSGFAYRLIEAGASRSAVRELALAYGLGGRAEDLIAFAEGCARLGSTTEARAAFERALRQTLSQAQAARVRGGLSRLPAPTAQAARAPITITSVPPR